jgi:hypothetical protein
VKAGQNGAGDGSCLSQLEREAAHIGEVSVDQVVFGTIRFEKRGCFVEQHPRGRGSAESKNIQAIHDWRGRRPYVPPKQTSPLFQSVQVGSGHWRAGSQSTQEVIRDDIRLGLLLIAP